MFRDLRNQLHVYVKNHVLDRSCFWTPFGIIQDFGIDLNFQIAIYFLALFTSLFKVTDGNCLQ